jgi:hypothetical protein
VVPKQCLHAHLRPGLTQHTDLQVRQALPQHAHILVRFRREAQPDPRSHLGHGGCQTGREGLDKTLIGANREDALQAGEFQHRVYGPQHRLDLLRQGLDALAQHGGMRGRHQPAPGTHE